MSVMCDLQLDMVGVGSLLTFDFRGPTANPNPSKVVSPSLPFDLDLALCPCKCRRPSATGKLPLTLAKIPSLNLDSIDFPLKLGVAHGFPGDVA
jgi:hypothetical protein